MLNEVIASKLELGTYRIRNGH